MSKPFTYTIVMHKYNKEKKKTTIGDLIDKKTLDELRGLTQKEIPDMPVVSKTEIAEK